MMVGPVAVDDEVVVGTEDTKDVVAGLRLELVSFEAPELLDT